MTSYSSSKPKPLYLRIILALLMLLLSSPSIEADESETSAEHPHRFTWTSGEEDHRDDFPMPERFVISRPKPTKPRPRPLYPTCPVIPACYNGNKILTANLYAITFQPESRDLLSTTEDIACVTSLFTIEPRNIGISIPLKKKIKEVTGETTNPIEPLPNL